MRIFKNALEPAVDPLLVNGIPHTIGIQIEYEDVLAVLTIVDVRIKLEERIPALVDAQRARLAHRKQRRPLDHLHDRSEFWRHPTDVEICPVPPWRNLIRVLCGVVVRISATAAPHCVGLHGHRRHLRGKTPSGEPSATKEETLGLSQTSRREDIV